MEKQYRTNYPSDVSDEEWAFVAPYLTLCREDAPQREHSLRAGSTVFATLCAPATSGASCRAICPVDGGLSADTALDAGRGLRDAGGGCAFAAARVRRTQATDNGDDRGQPHAAVDAGIGSAGKIRRRQAAQGLKGACGGRYVGSSPCIACDRSKRTGPRQIDWLAEEVQQITGRSVELAYVDQGYTSQTAAEAAAQHGIQLEVVKHTEAKRGSCCCQEDGSSSEALHGPLASADSPETTSGSINRSLDTTTSPSLGSCLPNSQNYSTKVHNGF